MPPTPLTQAALRRRTRANKELLLSSQPLGHQRNSIGPRRGIHPYPNSPLYDTITTTTEPACSRMPVYPCVLRISTLLECDMASDGTSTLPRRMEALYADIIVPRHIAKAFTYLVPPTLAQTIAIGRRVLVPFGHMVLEGVVISLSNHLATEIKSASLREIRSLAHDRQASTLPPALFELSRKISDYYVAPWGQCLRLILPPIATRKTSPSRYVATAQGRAALEAGLCPDHLKPTLDRIARRTSGILSSTLQRTRQGNVVRGIDALINKSWIALVPSNNATVDPQSRVGSSPWTSMIAELQCDGILPTETLPEVDSSWKKHVAQCLQSNQMRKLVLHAPWEHRLSRLADAIQQAHSMKQIHYRSHR